MRSVSSQSDDHFLSTLTWCESPSNDCMAGEVSFCGFAATYVVVMCDVASPEPCQGRALLSSSVRVMLHRARLSPSELTTGDRALPQKCRLRSQRVQVCCHMRCVAISHKWLHETPLQILDTMGAAAELMSTPPRQLEQQQGPATDPRVKPHLRLAAARDHAVAGMRQTGDFTWRPCQHSWRLLLHQTQTLTLVVTLALTLLALLS